LGFDVLLLPMFGINRCQRLGVARLKDNLYSRDCLFINGY